MGSDPPKKSVRLPLADLSHKSRSICASHQAFAWPKIFHQRCCSSCLSYFPACWVLHPSIPLHLTTEGWLDQSRPQNLCKGPQGGEKMSLQRFIPAGGSPLGVGWVLPGFPPGRRCNRPNSGSSPRRSGRRANRFWCIQWLFRNSHLQREMGLLTARPREQIWIWRRNKRESPCCSPKGLQSRADALEQRLLLPQRQN